MDKVRLGMVGARFAAHLHLNNYEKLRGPKLEIVGIASQNEKSAAQTAGNSRFPRSMPTIAGCLKERMWMQWTSAFPRIFTKR